MNDKIKMLRAVIPQALYSVRKRARRSLVRLRLDLAGAAPEDRVRAERLLRGHERYRQLRRADAVIVSYPKSGRTWLRVMISRLYQQVHHLPENVLIQFDNLHHMDRRVPRLLFTHDNYIRDYTGHADSKVDFHDRKVLLLVRDPRDVAVSQFFQWRYRTQARKMELNRLPQRERAYTVYDFVRQETFGLPRIIEFMNLWAQETDRIRDLAVLRYEDMRGDPDAALTRVARFLDIAADAAQIHEAVNDASYENMKEKEANRSFRMSGGRMAPRDQDNPDSYKVRRAKVGGYRDYFDDDQIRAIDRMVAERLDPVFGYGPSEQRAR